LTDPKNKSGYEIGVWIMTLLTSAVSSCNLTEIWGKKINHIFHGLYGDGSPPFEI
jgi:hypothetical protein